MIYTKHYNPYSTLLYIRTEDDALRWNYGGEADSPNGINFGMCETDSIIKQIHLAKYPDSPFMIHRSVRAL